MRLLERRRGGASPSRPPPDPQSWLAAGSQGRRNEWADEGRRWSPSPARPPAPPPRPSPPGSPGPASPVPRHLPQLQPQGLQLVGEAHELLLAAAAAAAGLRPVPPLLGQGPAGRPLIPLALGLGFPAAAARPGLRRLLSGHGLGPAARSSGRKSRRTAGRPLLCTEGGAHRPTEPSDGDAVTTAAPTLGTRVTWKSPAPSAVLDGHRDISRAG